MAGQYNALEAAFASLHCACTILALCCIIFPVYLEIPIPSGILSEFYNSPRAGCWTNIDRHRNLLLPYNFTAICCWYRTCYILSTTYALHDQLHVASLECDEVYT